VVFKALRIYWRLRPQIKELKKVMKMKFSLNMIVQILMILAQGYNQISDMIPDEHKTLAALIIGVVQAVTALLAHYANPDGSSVRTSYIPPKLKKGSNWSKGLILVPFLLLLGTSTTMAQDSTAGLAFGMAWNQNAEPQLQGVGTFDRQIKGRTYSYSGYTVSPEKKEGTRIPQLRFRFFSGIAVMAQDFGKLSVWVNGAPGLDTNALETGFMGAYGGFGHYKLSKRWGFILGGQGMSSTISGTDVLIYGMFRFSTSDN
jgi:hypothetical protein